MRIIAGEFRGRRLLGPESTATRPITDRVKQSLFDILAPRLEGAAVHDCFAGTGSMGLECLSRGARRVTFFEADRSAAARLRRNIQAVRVMDRSRVVAGDLFKWFEHNPGGDETGPADLIFLDPPYRFLLERPQALQQLARRMGEAHLAPDGLVIFRHDSADALTLPGLTAYDIRQYGSMTLELLRRDPPLTTNH
jgi:16S rRNA (guanine966-N2)-methyltransferase